MLEPSKKLNLGSGPFAPASWTNVDGSWNARISKYPAIKRLLGSLRVVPQKQLDMPWDPNVVVHDVRRPLPFDDDSMAVVYSSHLLEHVYLTEAKRLLEECLRVLEPGGVLRVVVPDLHTIVEEYASAEPSEPVWYEGEEMRPADRLNRRLHLRSANPPSGGFVYRA